MKTFLKYDCILQTALVVGYGVVIAVLMLLGKRHSDFTFSFYFVVGFLQLVSFLIRLNENYPKGFIYYFYGLMIMPVWFILLILVLGIDFFDFGVVILIAALYYSPVLAVLYLVELYYSYRNVQRLAA